MRGACVLNGFKALIPALLVLYSAPAAAECNQPSDPDCVRLAETFRGTVDFFATGASFTVNDDADDRPDRLLDVALVTVPQAKIPSRANLVKAYIYFGGSLYSDNDGNDSPDMDVELKVPGASDFVTVTGEKMNRSGSINGFPELSFYSVRADFTEVLKQAGGKMAGTYEVKGFNADIFNGDQEHTAANASYSIILIFEEPRLSPRNIVLFDGLQEVLGSTVTLDLSGFIVSQVPSGALTLYAQEGDCHPGPGDCANGNNQAGLERIQVIGEDPARKLVLSDSLNPSNDLFNRTINTVEPPLTDVPGTDIDTFDITPVLKGGDEKVTVEVTTPQPNNGNAGELVGLVYVIVGIDVFAPELREDSRIDITTERGEKLEAYYPGDPLRVSFALSNTGNIPGTKVDLSTELPEIVTQYIVHEEPDSSMLSNEPSGGMAGAGKITVSDISVRHGEVNDLVLLVETQCPLPEGGTLQISADVGAPDEGGTSFTLTASVSLLPTSVCGPRFFLYGGGGCTSTRSSSGETILGGLLLAGLLLFKRRRRLSMLCFLMVFAASQSACGESVSYPDPTDLAPPVPVGFDCPNDESMAIVPSIGGRPAYCMDRYEARIDAGKAVSQRFTHPARKVTWQQAKNACEAAGKRLCTADEWVTACRGDQDQTYPYGDSFEESTCNGYGANRADVVETGAMIRPANAADGFVEARGCVSQHGIYDLSGNVWEWNATDYFEGARKGLVGGSFRSNAIGLRCVTQDNHAPPDEENDAFGFRCCRDIP